MTEHAEVWTVTAQLRILRKEVMGRTWSSTVFKIEWHDNLQQKLQGSLGGERWVDVPVVGENGEPYTL